MNQRLKLGEQIQGWAMQEEPRVTISLGDHTQFCISRLQVLMGMLLV